MINHLLDLLMQSTSGDDEATLQIYNKFLPIINKLSRKLCYEEAKTDMTIKFLELIKNIKFDSLKSVDEWVLISYFKNSMYNAYNNLLKNKIMNKVECLPLNESDIYFYDCYEMLDEVDFNNLLCNLNSLQKKIIIGKFIYNYTDNELANILLISRQTIHNNKKTALKIIETSLKKA